MQAAVDTVEQILHYFWGGIHMQCNSTTYQEGGRAGGREGERTVLGETQQRFLK